MSNRFWKGAVESADPAERDARNLGRLAAHAERVVKNSSFYAARFSASGLDPADLTSRSALAELPPLSKSEIIADQAISPPYGTILGVDPESVVRQYIGPGPQTTYWTREDQEACVDDGAWAFFTNGFRSSDVVDITIMYHWVIAGTLMDAACQAIGCAVIPGGIGMTQQHLDAWRWSEVSAVFAFPTFLDELADKTRETGVDPAKDLALRIATVSGEQRTADAKTRMEEFWGGISVREFYGGAEVPFIAAEPEEGGWMHVNPDLIVEVVDPETYQPVAEGEPGVVVVSDGRRQAYPMIRYFTGDIIEGYTTEPGPSGRTTMRIGRVIGRHGDIPRVKGLFVVPGQVRKALDAIGEVPDFQLVIDRPGNQDTLTVRMEWAGDAEAPVDRIINSIKENTRLTALVEILPPATLGDHDLVVDRREL
jgi:phenylacetate-CoA ligase